MSKPAVLEGSPRRPTRLLLAVGLVVALVAVLVVVALARGHDSKSGAARDASSASSGAAGSSGASGSSGVSGSATQPSDTTAAAATGPPPLPLGSVADAPLPPPQGNQPVCAGGFNCRGVNVSCPGVKESMDATVAVATPTSAPPAGVVVFFSGKDGTNWWADSSDPDPIFAKLEADGLELVQVRWGGRGWLPSAPGEGVGPAVLACRPATLVKWVYDTIYTPMGARSRAPGVCGFCITGNSAGASQASYALTHFGLEPIIDHAALTSGPPHAALAKGCLRVPGDEAFYYDPSNAASIDASYGAGGSTGPCASHDASYADRWARDSADGILGNYTLTNAFVTFIFGDADPTVAPPHGTALATLLLARYPDRVSVEHIPHQRHPIAGNADGTAALRKALEGG